ncbi:MAG: 3-phosphoglycerate dehydrogenase [Defluviitaleaceae bacterium]|nr:3-phosphoglycerate dehydrogenase [Defluviitaleaceae bacterium]
MYKILALNKIAAIGTDQLPKDKFEIVSEEANPAGILLRSADMHTMELPAALLGVARAGAGVNNIPLDKCADEGIVVFNTPGANANAVKELVIFGLLASSRKVVQGINWVQSLKGQEGVAKTVEKEKGNYVGPEIMGKTIGVIGLGAIGILTSNAALALGMDIVGYDPFLSDANKAKLDPKVKIVKNMDELLAASDYVSLNLPLNKDTKFMFNESLFAKFKDGARLLNFARGELVCTEGVKKALASGKLSSYVIDFPDEHMLGVENIITIPHLGASTPESEDNCAYMAACQLRDYILNGNIVNSVNYPNLELECKGGVSRICILSKGACGDELAKAVSGLGKVLGSTVKENAGYGYAIFELDSKVSDVSAVEKLDKVVKVRVI